MDRVFKTGVKFMLLAVSVWFAAFSSIVSAKSTLSDYQVETVVSGLNHPWSMAFLPDGTMLVSERNGSIRQVENGKLSDPLSGLPEDVFIAGQGGWQDVVLHPGFARNGWVYLSYASGNQQANRLKVIRAKLQGDGFTEVETVFAVSPDKDTPVHYGARLLFLPDNTLLITTGDGFDYREDAQRLDNQMGKIIRINDDGSLPKNNPFVNQSDALTRFVYSYGHRNPQGLAFHPQLQQVFAHEHGPAGGDEINIIEAGNNYGWPVVTNGRDYSGAIITPYKEYPGMTQPAWDWTPSIAPSGMAVYVGDMFPEFQGDLLVGALKDKDVKHMKIESGKVTGQTSVFAELNARIRDVRVAENGSIYLVTDSADGAIYRIYRE